MRSNQEWARGGLQSCCRLTLFQRSNRVQTVAAMSRGASKPLGGSHQRQVATSQPTQLRAGRGHVQSVLPTPTGRPLAPYERVVAFAHYARHEAAPRARQLRQARARGCGAKSDGTAQLLVSGGYRGGTAALSGRVLQLHSRARAIDSRIVNPSAAQSHVIVPPSCPLAVARVS
jgi:hypothetical protein